MVLMPDARNIVSAIPDTRQLVCGVAAKVDRTMFDVEIQ